MAQQTRQSGGTIQSIKDLFKKQGFEVSESDLPALSAPAPAMPPFPFLIFFLAISKDIVDIFVIFPDLAGATVIGLILTVVGRLFITAFTITVWTILFLWMLGKLSTMFRFGAKMAGGAAKAGIANALEKRYIKNRVIQGGLGFILESIVPYIPMTTIFVFFAHYHENKYIKLIIEATEQYARAVKSGNVPHFYAQAIRRKTAEVRERAEQEIDRRVRESPLLTNVREVLREPSRSSAPTETEEVPSERPAKQPLNALASEEKRGPQERPREGRAQGGGGIGGSQGPRSIDTSAAAPTIGNKEEPAPRAVQPKPESATRTPPKTDIGEQPVFRQPPIPGR